MLCWTIVFIGGRDRPLSGMLVITKKERTIQGGDRGLSLQERKKKMGAREKATRLQLTPKSILKRKKTDERGGAKEGKGTPPNSAN